MSYIYVCMYMVNNGENINIFDESVVNHGDFHGLFTWSTDQGSADHGQYAEHRVSGQRHLQHK